MWRLRHGTYDGSTARRQSQRLTPLLLATAASCAMPAAVGADAFPAASDYATRWVTSTADQGRGTLRQAILDSLAAPGPDRIRFDSQRGPFADPQVIRLQSPLPGITDELAIDGYIPDRVWAATGVTLEAAEGQRILVVEASGSLELASLTLVRGGAEQGGAVLNRGRLQLIADTLAFNSAAADGGAVLNAGGQLVIVNSTFHANRAARGGAVASVAGSTAITNSTLAGNVALTGEGGAVYNAGALLLRNSILADSPSGSDCANAGTMAGGTTHNLIEANDRCGVALLGADPQLAQPGLYNGPTPTIPLQGGSPAINRGDNASALGSDGMPLEWDQRGNGDPRYAAGITDLGAFEVQTPTALIVDTTSDEDRRGCSRLAEDCSLRGSIELASAGHHALSVTFDPAVFARPESIAVGTPLPAGPEGLVIDATAAPGTVLQVRSCEALGAARVHFTRLEIRGPSGACRPAR